MGTATRLDDIRSELLDIETALFQNDKDKEDEDYLYKLKYLTGTDQLHVAKEKIDQLNQMVDEIVHVAEFDPIRQAQRSGIDESDLDEYSKAIKKIVNDNFKSKNELNNLIDKDEIWERVRYLEK